MMTWNIFVDGFVGGRSKLRKNWDLWLLLTETMEPWSRMTLNVAVGGEKASSPSKKISVAKCTRDVGGTIEENMNNFLWYDVWLPLFMGMLTSLMGDAHR